MNQIHNAVIVFDNSSRPETTGMYCLSALRELVHVTHFLPSDIHKIGQNEFDLVLFVDDGTEYNVPKRIRRSAFWAIDTHLAPDRLARQVRNCDFVFAAQKEGASLLSELAATNVQWLPLACDPNVHKRMAIPNTLDVSFVGNRFSGRRERLLETIKLNFTERYFVGNAYFDDLARIYSQSRFVVNQSLNNDINMRVFEAISCGALLLTDRIIENGFEELFQTGLHLETFQSPEEAVYKINEYSCDADKYGKVSMAGHRHVREFHTYRHRMQAILELIESGTSFHFGIKAPRFRKSPTYYHMPRTDVLNLVPDSAKSILEVGSAGGKLASQIKEKQNAHVIGVELDDTARAISRSRLDIVLGKQLEELDLGEQRIDCVICADVLEHMVRPEPALRKIHSILDTDGSLVLSLPNILHSGTIYSLLNGNFDYEAAGILDEDHKRFFTKTEIEKLLFRTGFEIETIAAVGCGELCQNDFSDGSVQLGQCRISGLTDDVRNELNHYQYLVRAVKKPLPKRGLTSIIVLTHNQLQYTSQCIDSIFLRTDETIELIVVDNGSTDGTVEYLKKLEARGDIKLILNSENLGFPAGVNQGITASTGETIVLLNNDTIVTTGWLSEMHDVMALNENIGLVGPLSNNVSGEQQIAVTYQDLASLDGFSWKHRKQFHRQHLETDRLVGFCLMIDRNVIEKIGLLDEQFGIGCFEDDDLCKRANDAGFSAAIATGAFVHHFGSVTFRSSNVDFSELLYQNKIKFDNKHLENADQDLSSERQSDDNLTQPTISLCMIVRNNRDTIRQCLQSVKEWVDEIIIVDTGSTDETIAICREFDAKIFHFPWCDDFSAARNESLKHATCDWVFWFDSDDVISKENGAILRELISRQNPADAYVVKVHCPRTNDDGAIDTTIVDHIKLFKNGRGFSFEGRIHEQILQSIRAINGRVDWSDCFVTHMGSDLNKTENNKKIERDLRILKLDLQERPNHPFVLFNLGMTYLDDGDYGEAINYLNKCVEVSTLGESHLAKAYALLASAYYRNQQISAAIEAADQGRTNFPDDAELNFIRALYAQESGDYDKAENIYKSLLEKKKTKLAFSSKVAGLDGVKAHHNLALVFEAKHDLRQAAIHWLHVAKLGGGIAAWQRYISAILQGAGIDEAREAKRIITSNKQIQSKDRSIFEAMIEIRLEMLQSHEGNAIRLIDKLIEGHPTDEYILNEICRFVFEQIDVVSSEKYLLELASIAPSNPSVLRNLAVVSEFKGEAEMAEGFRLQESNLTKQTH